MRAPPPLVDRTSRRVREPVRLRLGLAVGVTLLALALQILLPVHAPLTGLLDLPLLTVAYLAILRRHVLIGMLLGMATGLAQDSLTNEPLGLFGILKTVVGYLAAATSLYIEAGYPGVRAVLTAFLFLIHQILFWVLQGALLGGAIEVEPARAAILAAMHAGLALIVYRALDRLRIAKVVR